MAGVAVHHGDDPVPGHAPRDLKAPRGVLAQVLADDGGQELRGLREFDAQRSPLQGPEDRVGVGGDARHQRLPGVRVGPVARRLGPRGVTVAAGEEPPHSALRVARGLQHAADRGAQHRDGVLRRYRVVDRRRVQHPILRQRPRRTRHLEDRLEDAPRPIRSRQAGPHPHQHRVTEPPAVAIQTPARVTPTQIKLESRHRLTVRETEIALQHHHRRHHPRRHTAPAPRREQIIKHPPGEQPNTLTEQHRKHRTRSHAIAHKPRPLEQISLTRLNTNRHNTNLPTTRNHTPVTLPQPDHPKRREKHQPPRWLVPNGLLWGWCVAVFGGVGVSGCGFGLLVGVLAWVWGVGGGCGFR